MFWKAWVQTNPSRLISTSSRVDSALTTEIADAVQPAGHRVGLAVELAAGVQRGHDDLDRRALLDRVAVDRDAAAVVDDPDAAVGQQACDDGVGVAGQGLVDGVVDDLVDEVVQTALAGRADVHAGALAHRLETLEDGDGPRVVGQGCVSCSIMPQSQAAGGICARSRTRPWLGISLSILPVNRRHDGHLGHLWIDVAREHGWTIGPPTRG